MGPKKLDRAKGKKLITIPTLETGGHRLEIPQSNIDGTQSHLRKWQVYRRKANEKKATNKEKMTED